jgi:hypothetical protein
MISVRNQFLYTLLIIVVCNAGHRGLPSQPWTYDDLDRIEAAQKAQTDWTDNALQCRSQRTYPMGAQSLFYHHPFYHNLGYRSALALHLWHTAIEIQPNFAAAETLLKQIQSTE